MSDPHKREAASDESEEGEVYASGEEAEGEFSDSEEAEEEARGPPLGHRRPSVTSNAFEDACDGAGGETMAWQCAHCWKFNGLAGGRRQRGQRGWRCGRGRGSGR